ncbi:hypothetical protein EYF80_026151 [Liparis tanakae]|uniref:Uncharacterized protein n=1 Tax=Liparis tanakae TaxID=230148 RepID=A0A4Z2HEA3_9TELE|nr:hypothetical protein EYF80_026151 [Liparis tanakae]
MRSERQLLFTEMSGIATVALATPTASGVTPTAGGSGKASLCISVVAPRMSSHSLDLRRRLRPELNSVLSSSRGLVRDRPLAGLNSRGEEQHECALRGSGRVIFTGE